MSDMQSKEDNTESFNWYLKTLQEEQQRKMKFEKSGEEVVDSETVLDLLRFIKVFSPSVERLMEFCKAELRTSLLEATNILDKLEKDDEIVIEEISKSSGDSAHTPIVERIVRITSKGLEKI